MTLSIGDRLPAATFLEMGPDGVQDVPTAEVFSGQTVALFALPGAYTGVCSTQHMPSFIRVVDGLREKGVEAIICIAVNDPFVLKAWGEATGGTAAGIRILADASGAFTKAIGQSFDLPDKGFFGRSKRYSALVEDGVVEVLNLETGTGCEISAGETLLGQI